METKYFKNKATQDIAEYDPTIGSFYIIGDKSYIPISPGVIQGSPDWEIYSGPVDENNPLLIARKKFWAWVNGK